MVAQCPGGLDVNVVRVEESLLGGLCREQMAIRAKVSKGWGVSSTQGIRERFAYRDVFFGVRAMR